MKNKPKILSDTVKGVGGVAEKTVEAAKDQAKEAIDDAVSELTGSGGGSGKSSATDLDQFHQQNQEKTDKEIASLKSKIGGSRDVDAEIQEVREKRAKDEEEEQLLEEVQRQRQEEEAEAKKEAQMAGAGFGQGPLAQTGTKHQRGTALIQQRGKGKEIKGGRN